MEKSETAKIVTMIGLYEDLAEPSEEKVEAWHQILMDLTYGECESAALEHYRAESRRIWPADIRQHVLAERNFWLATHPEAGPQHPELVPPWQDAKKELE